VQSCCLASLRPDAAANFSTPIRGCGHNGKPAVASLKLSSSQRRSPFKKTHSRTFAEAGRQVKADVGSGHFSAAERRVALCRSQPLAAIIPESGHSAYHPSTPSAPTQLQTSALHRHRISGGSNATAGHTPNHLTSPRSPRPRSERPGWRVPPPARSSVPPYWGSRRCRRTS
jgi:hypothetical protein